MGDYPILHVVVPLHATEEAPIIFDDDIRDHLDFPVAVMYLRRDHIDEDSYKARVQDVIARVIAEVPLLGGELETLSTSSDAPRSVQSHTRQSARSESESESPSDPTRHTAHGEDLRTPTVSTVDEEVGAGASIVDTGEAIGNERLLEVHAGTGSRTVEELKGEDERHVGRKPQELKRSRSDSVDFLGSTPQGSLREPQRRRTEDGSSTRKDA